MSTQPNNRSVENFSGGTIQNAPGSTGSAIVNGVEGHMINYEGANLLNGATCAACVIHNIGLIDNYGSLESEDSASGQILNEGTINNNGGSLRIGTGVANQLTNSSSGVINNDLGGVIANFNDILNRGYFHNWGTIDNSSGTVNNEGAIWN